MEGSRMIREHPPRMRQTVLRFPTAAFLLIIACCPFSVIRASDEKESGRIVVVVGAAGEQTYGQQFEAWAELWSQVAEKSNVEIESIGLAEPAKQSDHARLSAAIASAPSAPAVFPPGGSTRTRCRPSSRRVIRSRHCVRRAGTSSPRTMRRRWISYSLSAATRPTRRARSGRATP